MSSSNSSSSVAVAGCGSSCSLSFDHLHPPPPSPPTDEQLCYVHCHLCDTVLAVSVPSSSLLKTVTVRCGHCSNLLPVNMRALLLSPPPVAPSFTNSFFCPPNPNYHFQQGTPNPAPNFFLAQPNGATNYLTMSASSSSSTIRGGSNNHLLPRSPNTSRPPEKRQRVPSAYNRFIKEEIQRIKAGNPDISHREAFSAAAKNWAHFPHIQFGLMPDQTVKRTTNIRAHNPHSQDAGEDVRMKDGFFAASANVGVSPY